MGKQVILSDELGSRLVVEVQPLPSHFTVNLSNPLDRFLSSVAAFVRLAGHRTLSSSQLLHSRLVVPGVLHELTIGGDGKPCRTHVHAHLTPRSRERPSFYFAGVDCIPFVAFTLDSSGLDFAFYRAVQFDSDIPNPGEESGLFGDAESKLGVMQGIETVTPLKAWITRLFPRLNTSEKCLKRFVQP